MKKIALILTPGFADWEYSLIAGTSVYYGVEVRFYSPMPGILADYLSRLMAVCNHA